jgi:hypothetical protein
MNITEKILERKSSCFGQQIEITAVGIRRTDHAIRLLLVKVGINFSKSGGGSVSIVLSWAKAREFLC